MISYLFGIRIINFISMLGINFFVSTIKKMYVVTGGPFGVFQNVQVQALKSKYLFIMKQFFFCNKNNFELTFSCMKAIVF